MPYSYTTEYELSTNNREAVWEIEKEIKSTLEKYRPKINFKGSVQECFKISDKESILNIINKKENETVRDFKRE